MSVREQDFTQIPNVVFDYWMLRLKPATGCLLFYLCRKTFGSHKKSAEISLNQISLGMGRSIKTIIYSLKELQKLGLVVKEEKKKGKIFYTNIYSVNVIDSEEVDGRKNKKNTPNLVEA